MALSDVKALGPELSGMDDAAFAAFLADAQLEENESAWGALYELALKLRIAHDYVTSRPQETAEKGPVQRVSVGSVSISYAAPSQASISLGDAGLAGSRFGLRLLGLRRQYGVHLMVV